MISTSRVAARHPGFRPLRRTSREFDRVQRLNPAILQEDREPLKTIVGLVVDESDSQKLGNRTQQVQEALAALRSRFSELPQFELREIVARNGGAESADATTALFSALKEGLKDVPTNQVGGVIMLTDGQVHDVPDDASKLGFQAPLHALISGSPSDLDRRIVVKKSPRFGIVGRPSLKESTNA